MNKHPTYFTRSELAKAGPLFDPESLSRLDAVRALNAWKLVERVMLKRSELLGELNAAQSHVRVCSKLLDDVRKAPMMQLARTLPRTHISPTYAYERAVHCRKLELDVLSSHDRLWAAQRGVAMWDHVYGSTWA